MEGEEVPNGSTVERKHKEELKVLIISLLNVLQLIIDY